MTAPVSRPWAGPSAVAGLASIAVGALWLVVAGMIAVVVRLGTPAPAELLRDVADQRAAWIAANAVLIVQQAVLVFAMPALTALVGTAAASGTRGLLAMSGGALVASGVFHGVFGAHLASKVTTGPLPTDIVADAELVHALGDTCWFVGVAAMTAATALVSAAVWKHDALLAGIGVAAAVANTLQFGWFVDHGFAAFAALGTLLQAGWFVVAGAHYWRTTNPTRGRPHEQR